MRICNVLAVVMGLALSGSAAADEAAVNAHELGVAESLLIYCKKVDAEDASKLEDKIRAIVHGESELVVARVRLTSQYRSAYDAMSNFVAQVDEHNAKRPCTQAIRAGK